MRLRVLGFRPVTSALRLDDRPLSRRDRRRAAEVATRAFLDDAYFDYLLPGEQNRARALPILFGGQIGHLGQFARIVVVRDDVNNIVGAALWLTTGGFPLSIGAQIAQMPSSLRALYRHPRSLQVGGVYLRELLNVHPKEPHWYLMLLAVDPAMQRRGVGTMLMNDALARIDAEHVGAYLETQKEDNHAYYRRFGFDLRETLHPMPGGPPYYTMWRAAN
jgi:ribosomal protein S18 acetylase RimI-like enzyme